MTQKGIKKYYSLPKTQPTKSSSQPGLTPFPYQQTCPQVSIFKEHDNSKLYIHNLNIDFGHLCEPYPKHRNIKQKDKKDREDSLFKDIDIADEQSNELQTKRNKIESEIKRFTPNTNSRRKHTRSFRDLKKNNFCFSEQNNCLPENQVMRKTINIKLKQVYALQERLDAINDSTMETKKNSRRQLQTVILKSSADIENEEQCFQTKRLYKPSIVNSAGEKNKTSRKRLHSRIVRTYVGGQKMQMKIINYPDSSQYMRICGIKK